MFRTVRNVPRHKFNRPHLASNPSHTMLQSHSARPIAVIVSVTDRAHLT